MFADGTQHGSGRHGQNGFFYHGTISCSCVGLRKPLWVGKMGPGSRSGEPYASLAFIALLLLRQGPPL